jgi:hypothetical protein
LLDLLRKKFAKKNIQNLSVNIDLKLLSWKKQDSDMMKVFWGYLSLLLVLLIRMGFNADLDLDPALPQGGIGSGSRL